MLIIIDADCALGEHTVARLARACARSGRPVQALDLMTSPAGAPVSVRSPASRRCRHAARWSKLAPRARERTTSGLADGHADTIAHMTKPAEFAASVWQDFQALPPATPHPTPPYRT